MWCEGAVRRQSAQGPAGGPAWAGRRRPSTGIWVGGSSLLKKLELTPLLGWIQQPQMLMNLGQRHKPPAMQPKAPPIAPKSFSSIPKPLLQISKMASFSILLL